MPESPGELLKDVRDRLEELPARMAEVMGERPGGGGGAGISGGSRPSQFSFGNDMAGKLATLVHSFMQKPASKEPPRTPQLPLATPVTGFRLVGPIPLPVSIVGGIPTAKPVPQDAGAMRPPALPPVPVAAPPRSTVLAPQPRPTILANGAPKQTQLMPGPRPTMLASPPPVKPVAPVPMAAAPPPAATGLPGAAGGTGEVVPVLKQMLAQLTKLNEKSPQAPALGQQQAQGGATAPTSSRGFTTLYDSQSTTNRAQTSPSINIAVRRPQAGGPRRERGE